MIARHSSVPRVARRAIAAALPTIRMLTPCVPTHADAPETPVLAQLHVAAFPESWLLRRAQRKMLFGWTSPFGSKALRTGPLRASHAPLRTYMTCESIPIMLWPQTDVRTA